MPTPLADPEGIASAPDGALWFTETFGNKIGRITTAGIITEYSISGLFAQPSGITTGPDGALWFGEIGSGAGGTSFSKIGRMTTAGAITEYPLSSGGVGPLAITTGPDGALWFTESGGGSPKIGKITTAGAITEYSVSSIDIGLGCITAGPDGALWFCAGSGGIGRITTAGVITQFFLPTLGNTAHAITASSDGALWFTESGQSGTGSKIGRITTSGAITEYALPTDNSGPYSITVGPGGALWFTEYGGIGSQIGRIQLPARTGVLSHIAAGGGWETTITLINTSSTPTSASLTFHADDGSPLSLPLNVTQQGSTQPVNASTLSRVINPNSTLLINTGIQLAATVTGWAEVVSTGPVGGFAIFRQTPQTGSPSEGTVPLQTQFPSTMVLPYDNSAGFAMGVAIANLSTASTNITATIWDDSGTQLGLQTITIAGGGHTSFVLPNQLPQTAGKRGIVQFQSTAAGGIAGIGLRFSPFGTFTSVPAM